MPRAARSSGVLSQYETTVGCSDQGLDAAQARRDVRDAQRVDELGGALERAAHLEADHAAEAAHLPRRDGVLAVALEARVVHALDLRVLGEMARDRAGGCVRRARRAARASSRRAGSGRTRADRPRRRARRGACGSSRSALDCRSARPPITSLCPARYLAAECSTRSAPSASACWFTGVAKVESITTVAPLGRHSSATRATSITRR